MIEVIWKYLTLADPNTRFVAIATLLLGGVSGVVGTFNFLRKKTLIGETVAHATLPGIVIGFMLFQIKNPAILIIGAGLSGWLSITVVDHITRTTKIKGDSALAIVLSGFFGVGVLLLTVVQAYYPSEQSGLDHYIFGNAAAMTPVDGWTFGIVGVVVLLLVLAHYENLKSYIFNPEFTSSIGISAKRIDFIISTITILTIAIGIKAVGIVMMSALLIVPPTAARYWSNKMGVIVILSGVFGALGGYLGAFVSFASSKMPTGPWAIIVVTIIAFLSMMFSPKHGVMILKRRKRKLRERIEEENILKCGVQLEVRGHGKLFRREDVCTRQYMSPKTWNPAISRLHKNKLVERVYDRYTLTQEGRAYGVEIDRRHKIWEIYLQRRMQLKVHYVHDEAETMEHFLTPEIERDILDELKLCSRFNPLLEIHELVPQE